MVWLWLLACGAQESAEWVDQGCACLQAGRKTGDALLKVHLACVDCLGEIDIDHRCEVDAEDGRIVVSASARARSACPTQGACSPMVLDCEVPPLTDGRWTLVYGKAEVPLDAPLPTAPVCACPGSMNQR